MRINLTIFYKYKGFVYRKFSFETFKFITEMYCLVKLQYKTAISQI